MIVEVHSVKEIYLLLLLLNAVRYNQFSKYNQETVNILLGFF